MRLTADLVRFSSTDAARRCALTALALAATSCGGKDTSNPPPVASASTAASAQAAPSPTLSNAPPSAFSVTLESKAPIAFSGLTGGVWVGQAKPGHAAQAIGAGELEDKAMPAGLPEGEGRILGVSGRLPNAVWLSLEQPRTDGKTGPGPTPLYRLGKDGFKRFAEDWQPQIVAWSKNRLLSASTSSGRLKIKVIEPQLKDPPPDLPAARFGDEACAQSLKVKQLAALPGGEVFAAGNCSPEGVQGTRYVIVRWLPPDAAAPAGEAGAVKAAASAVAPTAAPVTSATAAASAGTTPASTAAASSVGTGAAAVASAVAGAAKGVAPGTAASAASGATAAAPGGSSTGADAGAAAPVEGVPGTLFVLPDVERNLTHRALFVRSATEAYVAAVDEGRRASYLARFDGNAWAVEPAPPASEPLRSIAGTSDGTLWALTERQIWKRPASGAWEQASPPDRAFPEPEPTWQFSDLWADGAEVWVAGRHASKADSRYVVLRTKETRSPLRWP